MVGLSSVWGGLEITSNLGKFTPKMFGDFAGFGGGWAG